MNTTEGNSNIRAPSQYESIDFNVRAQTTLLSKYALARINMTFGCYEEKTISGKVISPFSEAQPNITAINMQGGIFKIKLGKGASTANEFSEFALKDVVEWITDYAGCNAFSVSLVTDSTGKTLSNATDITLVANPTFLDIGKYEIVTSPVLKIDRKQTIYKWIYLKGSTMGTSVIPAVNSVIKALVVVCGDEKSIIVSPNDDVFNINLEKTASDAWVKYNIDGLFKTISSILPGDECPVTSYLVCNDSLCRASPN